MEPSLEDLKRISSEVDRDEVINNGAGVLEVVSQASNGNGLNTPYLKLLRQEHVTTEYYSRNTIHKLVHVVVKNLNFPIEIISNVDLTKCNGLEAKLFYDFDKLEDKEKKEVNYVKNPPLDYRVSLLEGGMKALIEARIKVLTSQHEDSLFKIRFSALEPSTGTELEVYSEPIKVISKLTQLKKPRGSSASGSSLNSSSSGIPSIPISSPDFPPSPTSILSLAEGKPLPITPPSSSSRKRQSQSQSQSNAQNVNSAQMNASLSLAAMANSASFMSVTSDTFAALERLEKQQEESFKVLKEIRGKIFGEDSNAITTEDISTGNNSESLGDNSYEQAFKSFIASISSANQSELQQRTELVLSSLNATELDHLASFVDILNSSSYFSQQPLLKKRQRSS